MPLAKIILSRFALSAGLIVPAGACLAQDETIPPRPDSRIHDAGSIFTADAKKKALAAEIRENLDALATETGCEVLLFTLTSSTGSTAGKTADSVAEAWLEPGSPGAVLLYERAGNRVSIAPNEPVKASIAEYLITTVEQSATSAREDIGPAETVALAARDLSALFRKHFGPEADEENPAIKADRILIGIVAAAVIALVSLVAFLHWRGEMQKA